MPYKNRWSNLCLETFPHISPRLSYLLSELEQEYYKVGISANQLKMIANHILISNLGGYDTYLNKYRNEYKFKKVTSIQDALRIINIWRYYKINAYPIIKPLSVYNLEKFIQNTEVDYKIEKIINHQSIFDDNKEEIIYEVKWEGYSSMENTWESIDDFNSLELEMVFKYNQKNNVINPIVLSKILELSTLAKSEDLVVEDDDETESNDEFKNTTFIPTTPVRNKESSSITPASTLNLTTPPMPQKRKAKEIEKDDSSDDESSNDESNDLFKKTKK